MDDQMFIFFSKAEAMQIIESLDNERSRWSQIIKDTNDEDIVFDYKNDIVALDQLITKFKQAAQKDFGEDIVELSHFPRGISL
ncbi:MAG: hypothetical protein H0V82_00285 [Candidatus Protochlamydia sp.]|nr:hypothetical protein [Candidatus Protochlamydia sp.]